MKFRPVALFLVLIAAISFSCAPPKSPAEEGVGAAVRFGLVTDSHYADTEARGSRPYRESLGKMREAVERLNGEKLDFLVELGDFKDQDDPPDPARTLAYLKTIESVFSEFRGPRYHVLGNHDLDSLSKSRFLKAARNTDVPKDRSYYNFGVKGVRFFVLDANFKSDGEAYDRGNFEWADANVPAEELAWLEKTLAASPSPAVVFIHQQLDGEGAYFVKNAPAVRKVLEESGKVLAVFQGHRHEGMFHWIKGIAYYTLKGMIEGSGPESNAYAVAEVDGGDNIRVQGFRKADIASKGGNFLLNVGPTAEGLFPPVSVERLREIGRWMKTNGEAVYAAQTSPFKALPWGRCTRKDIEGGARLYLHVFDWPADGKLIVPGILNEPLKSFLLADPGKTLEVTRAEDGLVLKVPARAPDQIDSVVVLDVAGKLDIK
jgi:predicted phosphodiesterase